MHKSGVNFNTSTLKYWDNIILINIERFLIKFKCSNEQLVSIYGSWTKKHLLDYYDSVY